MHKSSCSLARLDQVWLEGIDEEGGHRSGASEFLSSDWFPIPCTTDDDAAEPFAQVTIVPGKGKNSHHL